MEIPEAEVARVFDVDRPEWSVATLTHNPANAVTHGVWRVRVGDRSAVLKVLGGRIDPDAPWPASDEPRAWNYWRREALAYDHPPWRDVEGGIGTPRRLACFERSPVEIALWLEDVPGRPGEDFDLDDHAALARALGRCQARGARAEPWHSRGFLPDYTRLRPVRFDLLEDDRTWAHPLVAGSLGAEVREAGRRLVAEREWLLGVMAERPRRVCHLDLWPQNLIRRPEGGLVALDWAFTGDGALGEDLGNHVPDTAFDAVGWADRLHELDVDTFEAFLEGLAEGGFAVEERDVRLGVCASAVKYVWLLPLMLERILGEDHRAYGGGALDDPGLQARERGKTLIFLASWVAEARRLA